MPTRNISLTPEQDAFIEEAVKSGEYQNASEAVRDALRALQQRRREDALKLEALRKQIDAGVGALDRGEFTEIDDTERDRAKVGGRVKMFGSEGPMMERPRPNCPLQ